MTSHLASFARLSAVSAVLAALVAVTPASAAQQRQPAPVPAPTMPRASYNEAHPVLAYYYAWWDPSNFSRTLYTPTQPYNSDDLGAMRRHMEQAQAAGIDGFVMSWYGLYDRTNKNFANLLELGKQSGIRTTIHFETPLFAQYGQEDVVAQLRGFYQQYQNHPSLVRYQGRPVIFFWRAETYDNATWSAIRAAVDPNRTGVWIADGDKFDILRGDAWDGISPYAIAWSANPASQLPSWGAKATAAAPEKLYIPPVSPGCDDTAARAPTCVTGRADGSYYRATLEGALASNPPWALMVSTFNEWMESTQIEPSAQYGDQYIRMTRDFSDVFKGFNAAFQPIVPEPAAEPAPEVAPEAEPAEGA